MCVMLMLLMMMMMMVEVVDADDVGWLLLVFVGGVVVCWLWWCWIGMFDDAC